MEQIILIVHVLAALGIVALILIQQGKGADMGASFGAGASQTLFGSSGSGNVLTKTTAVLATIFFATSFGLAVVAKEKAELSGVDIDLPAVVETKVAPDEPVSDIPDIDVPGTGAASTDIPEIDIPKTDEAAIDAAIDAAIAPENSDIPQQIESPEIKTETQGVDDAGALE